MRELMCAATSANFWLRAVLPEQTESFAGVMAPTCGGLRTILGPEGALDSAKVVSSSCHSLGLTSAERSRVAGQWSSWAHCIHMIKQRHPSVADTSIMGIDPSPCIAVKNCHGTLEETGLEIPSWRTLADTPLAREADAELSDPKFGWQHRATRCLEEHHLRESALLAYSLSTVSLLERRPVLGTGEDDPSVHEVLRDARFG